MENNYLTIQLTIYNSRKEDLRAILKAFDIAGIKKKDINYSIISKKQYGRIYKNTKNT